MDRIVRLVAPAVDDVEETHVTAEELRNIMLLLPVLSGDEEVPGGRSSDSSASRPWCYVSKKVVEIPFRS